jgi:predicted DNA-binding transcriptional regulator AlpA
VLDLVQATALLGLGRTTAYRLVHDGQWPTPVLRLGRRIKIVSSVSTSIGELQQ